jgi:hypothetical protein
MEITPELLVFSFSIYIVTRLAIKIWADIKEHRRTDDGRK